MQSQQKSTASRRNLYEWLLLIAALVVVGVGFVYEHLAEVDRANAGERDRLHVIANFVANDIGGNLVTVNHVLTGVIQDYLTTPVVPEPSKYLTLRLQALEGAIPGIRALLVLDARGIVTHASKSTIAGRDLSYRDYFKTVRDHPDKATLYISPPFQSLKQEPDLVITASRMVPGPNGEFAGVVVATLDQDYFSGSFTMAIYAPDVWGFVAHGDGQQIVNFPEKQGIDGIDLSKPGTFFSRHRQTGQIESVLTGKVYTTGEQRLMVLHTIQPAALHMDKAIVISISRELSAIALPLQRQAITYGLLFVAMVLIGSGLLYWMQTRRTRIEALRFALEQERMEANNELQATFDNMTEAVLVFDSAKTVVRANRAARSVLGLFDPTVSLEEVWAGIDVCLPSGEVLPQEEWPTRRGFRGDFVRNFELEIRRKDSGKAVLIELSVTPVYDESGEVSLLIATYTDVSERRLTHALRESEGRFRTLIEDAPLAIAILRRGHFVYTNSRYNILHGYSPEDDLKGMPWSTMISEDSHAILQTQEKLITEDSATEQTFEAEGLGKDGKLVPVFKTTTRVELIDGPATLIFAQDISAQKRAEAALLDARDSAEAANRSKADFLSNMSHEIRTPLNAILGMAYLVEQAPLDLDTHNMVRKIRASGRMLLGIINDILDVSKIEAGHMMIEQVPFRLNDVIDNLAATMGVAVADKNIQLIIQPLPVGISTLMGDSLRLEQVLSNLISNAIKFTQVGRVELRIALLSRVEDRVVLRFCVQDTGIGIAPELQADVFSAFTQADNSTTRRFGGTGLGLTICRRLVGLMDGEIGLTSTLGQGSEFWFTLPLQLVVNTEFSSPNMTRVDALIADDSELELKAIADIASGLGWQVSAVQSGAKVLEQIQARKGGKLPNVVILDWKMPEMDGLTTARAIRACLAEDECPIVIMATAYSLSSLASQPGAELVDAILNKPVTTSALYNATVEAQRRRVAAIDSSNLAQQSAQQGLEGVRVLIVDDSEINRDVAQRILCVQGATVNLANDGKQALDWLQLHPDEVDLVLMDVQMPVMDGIEATRRLRLMPQFNDLPIVALTAGAFKSQQEAARVAGMTHFISKPFDVPTTIALIQRLRREPSNADIQTGTFMLDKTTPDPGNVEHLLNSPVLDVATGLQIWSDIHIYRDYLRRFAGSYCNAMDTINTSLANENRAAAMSLLHKLSGVAGNMALHDTHRLAQEVERVLASGYDPTLILGRLDDALAQAMAAIDRFAPLVDTGAPEASPTPTVNDISAERRTEITQSLVELMNALNTDNPAPAEPILSRLSGQLRTRTLANISECVRNFDFQGAKINVHVLAAELGIALE